METVKIKYPLPCGCAGPKYVSLCPTHQVLERERHATALGVGNKHCPTCTCNKEESADVQ